MSSWGSGSSSDSSSRQPCFFNVRVTRSRIVPEYSDAEIEVELKAAGAVWTKLAPDETPRRVAQLVADQKVSSWFQGRMEFGPRALGGRSILGDARSPEMQSVMNLPRQRGPDSVPPSAE